MSQHGRNNNNNMKRHSPEPIALGSGLFFVCVMLTSILFDILVFGHAAIYLRLPSDYF